MLAYIDYHTEFFNVCTHCVMVTHSYARYDMTMPNDKKAVAILPLLLIKRRMNLTRTFLPCDLGSNETFNCCISLKNLLYSQA